MGRTKPKRRERKRYSQAARAGGGAPHQRICHCAGCRERTARERRDLLAAALAGDRPEAERIGLAFIADNGRVGHQIDAVRLLIESLASRTLNDPEDVDDLLEALIVPAPDAALVTQVAVTKRFYEALDDDVTVPELFSISGSVGYFVHAGVLGLTAVMDVIRTGSAPYLLRLRLLSRPSASALAHTGLAATVQDERRPSATLFVELLATDDIDAFWLASNPALIGGLTALAEECDFLTLVGGDQLPAEAALLHANAMPNTTLPALRSAHAMRRSVEETTVANAALERSRTGLQHALDTERNLTAMHREARYSAQARVGAAAPANPAPASAKQPSQTPSVDPIAHQALVDALAQTRHVLAQREVQLDELRHEVHTQQGQIQALQLSLRGAEMAPETPAEVSVPDSFESLPDWCEAVLGERVHVTAEAIAAARASSYVNPAKVYRALEALAACYWPMVYTPDQAHMRAWQARMGELGLDCSMVGRAASHPHTAGHYRSNVDGQTFVLNLHLRGNSSFDPRHGLRIYFARDDQRRRLIVGSFPGHLPNSQSN